MPPPYFAAACLLACSLMLQALCLPVSSNALSDFRSLTTPPKRLNACLNEGSIQTLCQRCAKSTKSNLVYPMCCEDQEEAREWCERYINFGIQ